MVRRFYARYEGTCAACFEHIYEGDYIGYIDDEVCCEDCCDDED